ncbi:MAG: oligoendopeptidase F [candidate division Zixibacteria bacterium]|nr:oligoendopeptidase F [candidate division Zixibacteria bacterium]MDH3935859.1 oligoendopeptidase F [candidate division Zixibacteria bacterium]MDH4034299.1 oligoendopeptidase F [candidate division Zixibacteria bacterium]
MTTDTKTKPKKLLQREDVNDGLKWNLADIYATEEAWEADFSKAQEIQKKAQAFAGKLAESPATLYACLKTRSDLGLICSSLYQYAHLNRDLDNRQSKYQAMSDRAAILNSEASAAFSFIEPELLQIDETKLLEMIEQLDKPDEYDFYIKELIRSRKHVRSEEVEELLAQSTVMARSSESIFTMLNDADLKYPTVNDEDGNEVMLTKQRFAKLMESSNRRVRQEAHAAFYSVYSDHLNTTGAALAGAVNRDVFYSRARRYDNCLEAALDGDNIPARVYESLIETTEAHLDGLHHYVSLRKRLLKLDEIRTFDLVCPLFPERDYEVPYEQAVEQTIQALEPLGPAYAEMLQHGFGSRWVDVRETEGKGSGAYSWGNYSCHPFVLMNYNDTVDNMFTLAHEMGHALHSYYSNQKQPYPKSQYSIFVAEVASTLNEGLLVQHLLSKATDKLDKLYILNRHVDNTLGTFFNQVMYAHFELEIHRRVEKGEALSPDSVNDLWTELTKKYFGPNLSFDELSGLKWSRVPHFYLNFYVFQYATSYAASQAILDKFLAGEEGLIERYLKLISSGGNDHPIEQLKLCGVDMTTPAPVEATLKLFADQIDEMDRLT